MEAAFAAAFLAAGLGVAGLAAFAAVVVFAATFLAAGAACVAVGVGVGASENIGPPLPLGLDAPNAVCRAENPSSPACSSIGP